MQARNQRFSHFAQELYVHGMDDTNAPESPTMRDAIRQNCLDELATEEVLALSRPPKSFPIPESLEHANVGIYNGIQVFYE